MDNASLPPTITGKHSIAASQYGFSSEPNLCAGISIPQPHLPRLSAVHNFVARDQRTVRTYTVKELGLTGAGCRPSGKCDRIRLQAPRMQLYCAAARALRTDHCEEDSSPLIPTSAHEVRYDHPGWCVSSVQSQSSVQSGNPSCSYVKNVGFQARTMESPASCLGLSRAPVDRQNKNAALVKGHQVLAPAFLTVRNPEKQVLLPQDLLNAPECALVQENYQKNIVYQERPPNVCVLSEANAVTPCQPAFSPQGNSLLQHAEARSSRPASSPESRWLNLMAFLSNRRYRSLDGAISFVRPAKRNLPVDTNSHNLSSGVVLGRETLQPVGVRVMRSEETISANPEKLSLHQNLRRLKKLHHFTRHEPKVPVLSVETARACASPYQEVAPVDMSSPPVSSVPVSQCPVFSQEKVVPCSQNKLQRLANPPEKAFYFERSRRRTHALYDNSTASLNDNLSSADVEQPIECQQPVTSLMGSPTCNSTRSATSDCGLGLSCSFVKKHRKRKLEFIDLTGCDRQISDDRHDLSLLPGIRLLSSDTERIDAEYLLADSEYTKRSSSHDNSSNVHRSFELDVTLQEDLVHLSEKDMPPLSLMEEMNDLCGNTKAVVEVVSPMLTEQLYHKEHSAYEATDEKCEAQSPIDTHVKESIGAIMDNSVEARDVNVIAPLRNDDHQKSCLHNVQAFYNQGSGHLPSILGESICGQPGITTSTENVVEIDSTSSKASSDRRVELSDTFSLRSQPSFQPVVLLERLPKKFLKEAASGADVRTKIGFKPKRVRNVNDLLDSADFETTCEGFTKTCCDVLDSKGVESSSDSCSDVSDLLELKDFIALSDSDDADESSLCPAGVQERPTKPLTETAENVSLPEFQRGRASKVPGYSTNPVQPFQTLIDRSNGASRSPTLCDPALPTFGTDSPIIGKGSLKRDMSEKIIRSRKSWSSENDFTKSDQIIVSRIGRLTTPSSMLPGETGVHTAHSPSDGHQHTNLGIPNSTYRVTSKLGGSRTSCSVDTETLGLNRLKGNRFMNASDKLRIFDGSQYHKRLLKMKRRGAGKKLRRTVVSVPAEKYSPKSRSSPCVKQTEDNDQLSAGVKSQSRSNLGSASMQLYRLGGVQVKPVGKVSLRVEAQGRRYARVSLVGVDDKCDPSSLDKSPSTILSSLQTRSLSGSS